MGKKITETIGSHWRELPAVADRWVSTVFGTLQLKMHRCKKCLKEFYETEFYMKSAGDRTEKSYLRRSLCCDCYIKSNGRVKDKKESGAELYFYSETE